MRIERKKMTKNKIENGSAFKAVEAFVEGKPQSITLDISQLEKLARLEFGLAVMLEDIQNFNDEIGNNHEPNFPDLKVTKIKEKK